MPPKRKVDVEPIEPKKTPNSGLEVIHNAQLNLEEELEGYHGTTLVQRLVYIAQRCPEAAEEAIRRALTVLKDGKAFKRAVEIAQLARNSPWVNLDALAKELAEAAPTKAQESSKQEGSFRLQNEVAENKRIGEKDIIRRSLMKLGKHHLDYGEPGLALPVFHEVREFDGPNKEILETCMNIIICAFELNNPAHVTAQVSRARRLPEVKNDALLVQKLAVCQGLMHLKNRNYRAATQELLQAGAAIKNHFGEVTTTRELAAITSMCCLSTQGREEIKSYLQDGSGLKELIETTPPWRAILTDFTSSRYANCFRILDEMTPFRRLDYHLGAHWLDLVHEVRDRGLVQYFAPFLSIRLANFGKAFGLDPEVLEHHVVRLIQNNSLQARIDRQEKVLHAKVKDQRSSTFTHVNKLGESHVKDISAMLMSLSLMQSQFVIKDEKGSRHKEHKEDSVAGKRRQREDDDIAKALAASVEEDGENGRSSRSSSSSSVAGAASKSSSSGGAAGGSSSVSMHIQFDDCD